MAATAQGQLAPYPGVAPVPGVPLHLISRKIYQLKGNFQLKKYINRTPHSQLQKIPRRILTSSPSVAPLQSQVIVMHKARSESLEYSLFIAHTSCYTEILLRLY